MHKTRLFLLDARKPHPPTAFEANGLLAERLRSGLRFHEPLSAKASQGSMTGWFTPILSGPAAASRAGGPCAGADRPAPDSPRIPDSPAAFLESGRGILRQSEALSSSQPVFCWLTVHRQRPRIFIRQARSEWRDFVGFGDGELKRSCAPAISIAQ